MNVVEWLEKQVCSLKSFLGNSVCQGSQIYGLLEVQDEQKDGNYISQFDPEFPANLPSL